MKELVISFLNGNKKYVTERMKEELKNATEYDYFNDLKSVCISDYSNDPEDLQLFINMVLNYFYYL